MGGDYRKPRLVEDSLRRAKKHTSPLLQREMVDILASLFEPRAGLLDTKLACDWKSVTQQASWKLRLHGSEPF